MAEQSVVIRISAKNLTAAEFKKARQQVLGLGDETEKTTRKTSGLERGFRSVARSVPGALKIVAAAAAATGAAIAGLGVAVVKLGQRGTELVGINDGFVRLTGAVGESGEAMLDVTRTATKGLITDLDIMRATNKGLLLGLPITSKSMGELASTSIILGKAMGQGAAKSLDDLIIGLGRSSPLILDNLGITVKVGEANEVYAAKLGKTVKQLTGAEKKTAFYEATLEAARAKVEELGGIQLTFGDRLQQTSTLFENFNDKLSIAIARSPVFASGLESVRESLERAFGPDTKDQVIGIVNIIERAALIAIEFGQAGITSAQFITQGFAGIKVLILGVQLGFSALQTKIAETAATTLEAASKIPGLGRAYKGAATDARAAADASGAYTFLLKQEITEAAIAAAGNNEFGRSLQTARTVLDEMKTSMVNAGLSQAGLNTALAEGVVQVTNIGTVSTFTKEQLKAMMEGIGTTSVALGEMSVDAETWAEDMGIASDKVKTGQELVASTFTATGVQIGGVQSAIQAAFARMGVSTRGELEKTAKQAKQDYDVIEKSGKASAKELDKAWEKYEKARQAASEKTKEFTVNQGLELVGTLSGQFAQLGGKFKVFAIAEAIISTYLSVAKTWATYGWPLGIPFAAGALATGLATVSQIRSQGFRHGTEKLDFEDFGQGTRTVLHRREAVIPQGSGHMLGREVAGELARGGQRSDPLLLAELSELRRSISELRADLPRSIQRAVRDGVLLAS